MKKEDEERERGWGRVEVRGVYPTCNTDMSLPPREPRNLTGTEGKVKD